MLKLAKPHRLLPGLQKLFKYIGPGFLITVGFIDPGNWAANIAAGSQFGYSLLWMVTLSTLMLIMLQHNAAHLGIVTGRCLAESATLYFRPLISRLFLLSALGAACSTALAEILGAAIGLNMLFQIPLTIGATMTAGIVITLILSNQYNKIEKYIIGFVSLIGLAFLYELTLVHIAWPQAFQGWVVPTMPIHSLAIIMSVLGAVVMPHNIFLHSEIIQSRQWNLQEDAVIKQQLKYEFTDTLISMIAGWAINSAMIILAAAVFFQQGIIVTQLPQAQATLTPLVGSLSGSIFAIALLLAGFASSITAGIAGASIFAGFWKEPYDTRDPHSKLGVLLTIGLGLGVIYFLKDPFQGLLWSQILLSIQLPFTIIALLVLTSSKKVMQKYANTAIDRTLLWLIAAFVIILNVWFVLSLFHR